MQQSSTVIFAEISPVGTVQPFVEDTAEASFGYDRIIPLLQLLERGISDVDFKSSILVSNLFGEIGESRNYRDSTENGTKSANSIPAHGVTGLPDVGR